jgi:hypothetical protein
LKPVAVAVIVVPVADTGQDQIDPASLAVMPEARETQVSLLLVVTVKTSFVGFVAQLFSQKETPSRFV